MHKILKSGRSDLKVYIIENECYSDLKEAMNKYTIDFQLDPPHMHSQNSAERVIRTCKNYFISGFLATDLYLPISKWGHLLSQCLITLNLLRNYIFKPDLSVYAYLYGPYKFNKFPMAPPETRVIAHSKPVNHTSWGHHGTPCWYIGPLLDHYRYMQCYMPVTSIVRITDKLQYTPK